MGSGLVELGPGSVVLGLLIWSRIFLNCCVYVIGILSHGASSLGLGHIASGISLFDIKSNFSRYLT